MKTIFKKYTALICALCTVMLVISGCAFDDLQTAKGEPGTGTITLSINGANSGRTIYPANVTFARYVVSVYDSTENLYRPADTISTGSIDISLPITTAYKITVDAYVHEADIEEGKIAASGTVNVTATDLAAEHTSKSLNVTLTPAASGNGTFEWDITLDNSIIGAEIKIGVNDPIVIKGTGAVTATSATLAKGAYTVVFKLTYAEGKSVEFAEDLYIFANMTSVYTGVFRDFHFYEMIDHVIGILHKEEFWNARLAELHSEFFTELAITYKDKTFANVIAEFEHIVGSNTSLLPENLTELKALVDAVLIRINIEAKTSSYADRDAVISDNDTVIANSSTLDYSSLSGVNHNEVTITVGGKYHVIAHVVPPVNSFDITVGADTQTIQASEMGGANRTIAIIDNGYTHTYTAGNEYSFVTFNVALGAKKLSDFGTVEFDISGLSGDVQWKNYVLLAASSIPDTAPVGHSTITVSSTVQSPGNGANTPTSGKITLTINQSDATKALTGNITVALFSSQPNSTGNTPSAGSTTAFSFSNIKFIPGIQCEHCSHFPCECPSSFDITIPGASSDKNTITKTDFVLWTDYGTPSIKTINGGYEYTYQAAGNNHSIAGIPINLGEKTLKDFKSITFKVTALAGDSTYKDFSLIAWGDTMPARGEDLSPNTIYSTTGNNATTGIGSTNTVTLNIDSEGTGYNTVKDLSELKIALYSSMGLNSSDVITRYKVTDIEFVAGDDD